MIKEKENTMKENNAITKFFNNSNLKEKIDFVAGFIATTNFEIIPITDKELNLEKLQTLVGGYIELAYYPDDNFEMIVDEEGLIKHKQINLLAYAITRQKLAGNVLFIKKGMLK